MQRGARRIGAAGSWICKKQRSEEGLPVGALLPISALLWDDMPFRPIIGQFHGQALLSAAPLEKGARVSGPDFACLGAG
jgi:hypothetical protein